MLLLLCAGAARDDRDDPMASFARARMHELAVCFQLGEAPSARSALDLEVQPSGAVSAFTIGPEVAPTVAECVDRRVRAWRFPSFSGAPRRLRCVLVYVERDARIR